MLNALGIFLKWPETGKVKTRLGREITFERSCAFYQKAVTYLLHDLGFHPCNPPLPNLTITLFFDPPDKGGLLTQWLQIPKFFFHPQVEGDLGMRMSSAFSTLFERGAKKAFLIGTDCLTFTPKDLKLAIDGLHSRDMVLGPARDGGYYLIGLGNLYPELFQDIPWSSEKVLSTTLQRGKLLNLSTTLLDEKLDIDRVEDLKELSSTPALRWLKNFL